MINVSGNLLIISTCSSLCFYRLTGFQVPPPVTSTGNVFSLRLTSDFAVSAHGFKLNYEGQKASACICLWKLVCDHVPDHGLCLNADLYSSKKWTGYWTTTVTTIKCQVKFQSSHRTVAMSHVREKGIQKTKTHVDWPLVFECRVNQAGALCVVYYRQPWFIFERHLYLEKAKMPHKEPF